MKTLILGHGRHGKDTAAEILRDLYGLRFASSSRFVFERAVWPVIGHEYDTEEECYADRRERREEWRQLIKAYNTPDLSRLARDLLVEHDIYVGMRDDEEYEASKHLFDLIIWVDAAGRVPLEESMRVRFNDREMVRIDNNRRDFGEHMRWQLQRLRLGECTE